MVPVDLPGLRRLEVMAAAVGVEAHRQAVLRENLFQRPEGRVRPLLLDQKGRIDRAGRVVEGDDQVERGLALEPFVARAVRCSIIPRSGRRSRLRRCAPLRGAFGAKPFHCRCSLSHV